MRERAAALMAMDAADLPLYGIPFAVKDNMDVAGMPTTAACPAFAYTPERTATVVQRMLDAGPWVAERLAAIAPFHAAHADALDPTVRGIIESGSAYRAADLFVAQYRLQALLRDTASAWRAFDVMLLPTAPAIPTVESVAADSVGCNSLLGTYTNFVNLLDLAAIAVPAGFQPDVLPFGVTLIAPAFTDAAFAAWADRLHRAADAPLGDGTANAVPPPP